MVKVMINNDSNMREKQSTKKKFWKSITTHFTSHARHINLVMNDAENVTYEIYLI